MQNKIWRICKAQILNKIHFHRTEAGSAAQSDGDGGSQWVLDHMAGAFGARAVGSILHHQVPHRRAVEDAESRANTARGDQLLG